MRDFHARVSVVYEEEKRRQRMRSRQSRERRANPPSRRLSLFAESDRLIIPALPFPVMDGEPEEQGNIATDRRRKSFAALSRGDIRPKAQAALRDTFAVQCAHGALKRPKIHVSFTYPRSARECCACEEATDFLFVYVGLCNILVLQFVVVILLFFVDKELDIDTMDSYYPGGYFSQ